MSIKLGLNIASLTGQRRLGQVTEGIANVYERLSSGQRINRASDDPAALSLLGNLRTDQRVYTQATRNINDAISLVNVYSAGLDSLQTIVTRQLELAGQSANGTYSLQQRRALHREANALVEEYNRIVDSMEFNGRKLLTPGNTEVQIQSGYGANDYLTIPLGSQIGRTVGTGTFTPGTTISATGTIQTFHIADINRDGINDIVAPDASVGTIGVFIGNGNGTFQSRVGYGSTVGGGYTQSGLVDLNRDGNLDIISTLGYSGGVQVAMGNSDGSFGAQTTYTAGAETNALVVADFNKDGVSDFVAIDRISQRAFVYLNSGSGSFTLSRSYNLGVGDHYTASSGDFNSDGNIDLISNPYGYGTGVLLYGDGTGTFTPGGTVMHGHVPTLPITGTDINRDGLDDVIVVGARLGGAIGVVLGNGNGTFQNALQFGPSGASSRALELTDFNGDGFDDIVTADDVQSLLYVALGNGDGTFRPGLTYPADYFFSNQIENVAVGDVNNDGVADIATSSISSGGNIALLVANTERTFTQAHLDLLDASSARTELSNLQGTMSRIAAERGVIGATQSRLEVAMRSNQTLVTELANAESRINSIDVAQETGELIRLQILQRTTTAVLSQANLNPRLALELL